MNELERLEAMLRARPAALFNEQRREAYEALGEVFPLAAADVRVQPVAAHGVPEEWTSTPLASTTHIHKRPLQSRYVTSALPNAASPLTVTSSR